ncbi:hypothetical protein ASPACDRAFT_62478 [Aspergillus aculeatus ATCC 16872]|uniref:BTB domain-containing protein n=1 Tax=Aspergillus aculeatus (strain ATCC 16872 / CBS 172.66 / WB 5094) TaxID=690307 RepID=A0A1L9WMW4_ASPA1|nr:uncharacterized protein ASPACDRAFT_62478 [Aspergillus aculeatus ATCC 16872]OJJ97460.1 hypothetical protein ASPACDRAFT_62478 [Aspergillus aculeatus ATCC 16872]
MSDTNIYSFHPEGKVIFVLTEEPSTPSDSTYQGAHESGNFGGASARSRTCSSQRSYINLAELIPKDDNPSSIIALALKKEILKDERTLSEIPQAPNKYLIQASEKHLALSSPVFTQMLSGLWKETIDLATEGHIRFEIKKWDLQPFLIFLQVMHGRPEPKGLDVDTITEVALLVDYYQCLAEFRRAMRAWLKEVKKTLSPSYETYMKCLWVCWQLRRSSDFRDFGNLVVYFAGDLIEGEGLPFHPVVLGMTPLLAFFMSLTDYHADKLNAARKKALIPIIRRLPMHYNSERPAEWVHRGFCGECATLLSGLLDFDVRQATRDAYPVAPFSGLSFAKLVGMECRGRQCQDMGIIHIERMYQTVDHSDAGSVSQFVRKLNIKPVTLEECLKVMAR